MNDREEVRLWVVTGRVQGVGFRWFTARSAERLGLRGFVRNTIDGSVEVLAVGQPSRLEALEHALWDGPNLSDVDNVEKLSTSLEVDDFKSFEIR